MKKTILTVDDVDINNILLSDILSDDYDIISATGGQMAINQVRTNKPDLILMDIMMPILNGADTVKIIKSNPRNARIPVIFISAIASTNDTSINVDGVDYPILAKPIDIDLLFQLINENLYV